MATQAQVKLYVDKYRPLSIQAVQGTTISPDTVLTVSGVESAWGLSKLAKNDNNFFGIKAQTGYKGKKAAYPTKEIVKGQPIMINAYFRSYDSALDSFRDYVNLITKSARYKKVGQQITPAAQFAELQKAGYSTNPDYPKTMTATLANISKYFTAKNVAVASGGIGVVIALGVGVWLLTRKK